MRTIAVRSDIDIEDREFSSFDEALAAVLAESPSGSVIELHADDCEIVDAEEQCTCEPLELVVAHRREPSS